MARTKKEHNSIAPIGYDPRDLLDPREVSIKTGELSLVTLTDGPLQKAIVALPDELIMLTEKALKKKANPDELTCRLRIAFWDEYQQAVDAGRIISAARIMRGLTFTEFFYREILSDPLKVAWIVKPPQDFLMTLRDLLYIGLDRLREILEMPIIEKVPLMTKSGPARDAAGEIIYTEKVNMKLAAEIRSITDRLADRVHGAVIQRSQVDMKSASLHMHAKADPFSALPTDQLQALDLQLTAINQKLAVHAPKPELPDPGEAFLDVLKIGDE